MSTESPVTTRQYQDGAPLPAKCMGLTSPDVTKESQDGQDICPSTAQHGVSKEKSDKEIMREIQAIMRQIASSITYLPCLDKPYKDVAVPFTWIESDAKLIQNPQMVKLHSFDTKIHKVDTLVSYKNNEWDEV
ncbi:Mitotic spindle checkpoint protein MAD2 [Acorus calamus]|uniref:Mitotic spindle checkpoint protein MAD2 n=1 Tax=Acorus calamus TaxID=4465 RepID=A0AAV9EMA0_ACOCL|nr:Mitotic spindle checkpoint protein MAD2 [Acorus calamus]